MALQRPEEIMSGHKIIHIDMTRELDLSDQKKSMTRIDVQQQEQKEDKSEPFNKKPRPKLTTQ